jgi:3-mercaptopyruvate sulfurtransferase SseA
VPTLAENRKRIVPLIFVGGGILLLLAVLAWVLLNQQSAPASMATPASVQQVERISLEDAKAAFDANNAIFVDVRASSSYEVSHISGAKSIPLNDLPNRVGELDPKSRIITY